MTERVSAPLPLIIDESDDSEDADVILLISKPREFDEQEDLASDAVARDLIIAKQRNGPVGTVPLMFTKNLTRFENYTPQPA